MCQYSISEIEKLSGIKAHTIRIWEKRYNLLKTKRTDTNIRFYDDEDLRLMLNVSMLVNNGIRISKVAKMSPSEINAKVNEIGGKDQPGEYEINAMVIAMNDYDEPRFDKLITTCLLKSGVEQTILKIIYPFLNKIGVMWQTASINPAQEHFISNLIRQKILVATDGLAIPDRLHSKRFLLFLPEGELHEIGLLFSNYLIRSRGNHTLYLGQTVPLKDLAETQKYYKADYLFTIITSGKKGDELKTYFSELKSRFPGTAILVSGSAIENYNINTLPAGFTYVREASDTVAFLETLQHAKNRDGN